MLVAIAALARNYTLLIEATSGAELSQGDAASRKAPQPAKAI